MEYNGRKLIGTKCYTCGLLVMAPHLTWGSCQCDDETFNPWQMVGAVLTDAEMTELLASGKEPSNVWVVPDREAVSRMLERDQDQTKSE